jgi:hypothetical protein
MNVIFAKVVTSRAEAPLSIETIAWCNGRMVIRRTGIEVYDTKYITKYIMVWGRQRSLVQTQHRPLEKHKGAGHAMASPFSFIYRINRYS